MGKTDGIIQVDGNRTSQVFDAERIQCETGKPVVNHLVTPIRHS